MGLPIHQPLLSSEVKILGNLASKEKLQGVLESLQWQNAYFCMQQVMIWRLLYMLSGNGFVIYLFAAKVWI